NDGTPNALTFDLDDDQALAKVQQLVRDGIIPEPNVTTIRTASQHAHIIYFIDGFAASPAQHATLRAIAGRLTYLIGSDIAFAGKMTYNPLHPDFETHWGTSHRYSFAELRAYSDKAPNITRGTLVKALNEAGGRNATLKVRLTAW